MKGKFWIGVGLSLVGMFFAWQEFQKTHPGESPTDMVKGQIEGVGKQINSATN